MRYLNFGFVAPADDFVNVPQKPTLLLPSLTGLDTKAAPKVKLTRVRRAARLENNYPLASVRTFFPELFGRDRLIWTIAIFDEDILNLPA